ncbi:TadE family protein [Botrimarina sp.]|uniref:TadE family protein n=1 Tax=Botrimarina sp. TaxID=2795802 RepID=UPI0032ECC74D
MRTPARRTTRRRDRRGVETVELALSLPILVTILFGTLECCELLFTKQSIAVAAYESGRVAARRDATTEAVTNRFNQIVAARRLVGATMTLTPGDLSALSIGEEIRIDVTAPVAENSTSQIVLAALPDLQETVTFVRE